jgi:hypothetical protein
LFGTSFLRAPSHFYRIVNAFAAKKKLTDEVLKFTNSREKSVEKGEKVDIPALQVVQKCTTTDTLSQKA